LLQPEHLEHSTANPGECKVIWFEKSRDYGSGEEAKLEKEIAA
jgi:hypothetical protein